MGRYSDIPGQHYIYFIRLRREGRKNVIKIGASKDPDVRLSFLETEYNCIGELLYTRLCEQIECTFGMNTKQCKQEFIVHDIFRSTRLGIKELFWEDEKIIVYIETIRKQHTQLDIERENSRKHRVKCNNALKPRCILCKRMMSKKERYIWSDEKGFGQFIYEWLCTFKSCGA